MALAVLRVLHVAALTSASGRRELSTSKSLSQQERGVKVVFSGQYKQGYTRYVCGGDRTTCGDYRGFPLPWWIRNVM